MKKRIAKKISRRVRLDFDIALFNGYTFGVNPFIEERTVVLDKPLRIYSLSQFKKACKVLNKAVPECTFGSTPAKPIFGHISGKRANTHWICFMKGGMI